MSATALFMEDIFRFFLSLRCLRCQPWSMCFTTPSVKLKTLNECQKETGNISESWKRGWIPYSKNHFFNNIYFKFRTFHNGFNLNKCQMNNWKDNLSKTRPINIDSLDEKYSWQSFKCCIFLTFHRYKSYINFLKTFSRPQAPFNWPITKI